MKKITLVSFLFICQIGFAQDGIPSLEKHLLKANLFLGGIGASYEHKLQKNISIFVEPSYNIGYSTPIGTQFYAGMGLQTRYYYNFLQRSALGRNIKKNSANYLALSGFFTEKSMVINRNSVGIVWGIQRTYPSRINIDFSVGVGYIFSDTRSPLDVIPRLGIGYVFSK